MLDLASRLSQGIPEVRVDFYEVAGKVYFGELTFFDGSGFDKIEPLMKAGHSNWKPNTIHYIFKNRGGKYKGVMVWTCTNLDIMVEKDCFVTNLNYELIPEIKPTILD